MAGVTARVSVMFGHLQRQAARPSPALCTTAASKRSSSSSSAAGDAWWAKHSRIPVLDSEMSYFDSDPGADKTTVIFLHGNPTSSFLWRNIIPLVQPHARCIAPDLIGMGRSGKNPSGSYRFVDHYRYLSAFLDKVKVPSQLSLVLHDWGSGLGFHWSHQNPARVRGIAYMEALVAPVKKWEHFPDISRKVFQAMRSEGGEEMVLKKNFFVERLLPMAVVRELSEDEMAAYREPFLEPGESRRPTLTWPREIPVVSDGPQDVVEIVQGYREWLKATDDIPKLYVHAKPGFFSSANKKVSEEWPNVKTVTVKGLHFIQEDSPQEIGEAIAEFVKDM
ncbi:PREDICTED: renilla-luciferin 2-monooxygenase-like isoform X1 [Branchiostoma belcheri]|uniref:Renilla-luciferin 2-monooxygenase-like isoform X1 n=1 Tax=Branchiostoma belcheri TaxID=7741 RepID=A0A6P4YU32_BRABE|nr:PREDICTED: renilla-luciferin 2-monooxygenase-like isoform X1 [Branchiostoma belcheri]